MITMAKLDSCLLIILMITIAVTFPTANSHGSFSKEASKEELGLKEEKMTHLHFYMHDVSDGSATATAIPVTKILNNSTFYGGVYLADDPLTLELARDSEPVGRGRGTYIFPVRPPTFVLEMAYNLGFTYGEYNGSSLCLLGSITPASVVNELAITGGTGVFRFASGYAVGKLVTLDIKANLIVREFDVYVSHY